MVYFQRVEQLRVAAALPLTATNSGGPVGTLQTNREAELSERSEAKRSEAEFSAAGPSHPAASFFSILFLLKNTLVY